MNDSSRETTGTQELSGPINVSGQRSPAPTKTLSRPERGFVRSSMVQLTLVRFREFIREPEAVFWTFIFPILLAAGLGIAFRQRGPDKLPVGVITRPNSQTLIDALKKDSTLVIQSLGDSAG